MTKDEIIEMACQAFGGVIKKEERDNFIAFAKLVEAKKRTWVGLTDEEIDQGLLRSNYALQTASAWRDGVEWATKQLMERNT